MRNAQGDCIPLDLEVDANPPTAGECAVVFALMQLRPDNGGYCYGLITSIGYWGEMMKCKPPASWTRTCCRESRGQCARNDKWVHCVMACDLTHFGSSCGGASFARCAMLFGEIIKWDPTDIVANNDGVACATSGVACKKCCSGKYSECPPTVKDCKDHD